MFVAPTRFSAGVPLKVLEAAAYGLPVVATDLLREQLGWEAGKHLLASPASDADAFADHCVRLATDQALWRSLRAGGARTGALTSAIHAGGRPTLRRLLDGVEGRARLRP